MRWVGHVAYMEERRGACRVLVGKPEGKMPLVMRRHRWDDIIQINLKEIEWEGMDWIQMAQDRDKRI
jgi:hypothetical protein